MLSKNKMHDIIINFLSVEQLVVHCTSVHEYHCIFIFIILHLVYDLIVTTDYVYGSDVLISKLLCLQCRS